MAIDAAPAPAAPATDAYPPARWATALGGVVAAGAALAAGEFLGGLLTAVPSLIEAVGDLVIDTAPAPVKDAAIAVFGTADKVALVVGIVVVAALAGAGLGVLAARRLATGAAGFVAFGLLGAFAAARQPQASAVLSAGVAAVAAATGVGVLVLLRGRARIVTAGGTGSGSAAPAASRRDFLRWSLLVTAVGAGAAYLGRYLGSRTQVAAARADLLLPAAAAPLPDLPAGVALDTPGITPFVTPNASFYRIDTALSVPRVDPATWRLGVRGMVAQPLSFSLDDLLADDLVEADITIACVSNEVGGDLIGNARWLGVRLDEVLARAGVDPDGTQLVGRSVDGFTVGFPTAAATDGRDALIAVGMNGEPLPVEHGFPARLVVPGLYGYVSATKWLVEIELTTWEAFDAYWVPRGWSKEGPIKTQSRIDTPHGTVASGRVVIAGVAWAQQRGIQRVEVRVDDGQWRPATLADELNIDTWRQWALEWDAEPGEHVVQVRATDGAGVTQPSERTPVAPDGAAGWHAVRLTVA